MTRADPLRLVVLGDSLAVASNGCDSCLGFDRQYATYLRTVTGRQVVLDNLAVARSGIAGLQLALTSDDREARVAMADIVVVGVGFDDGPPWRLSGSCPAAPVRAIAEWAAAARAASPDCLGRTMTRYAAELDRLFATIERAAAGRPQVRVTLGVYSPYIGNPDILARSAPPAERVDVRSNAVAGIRQWNAMECKTARRHGFVCADIWRAFNGDDWQEQLRYLYGRDGLHPSATGQLEITQRLAAIDVSALW